MGTKNNKFIPIYTPYVATNQHKYVNECLSTNWISSKGKFVNTFENNLAKFLEVKHCLSTHNGTVSLMLAYAAMGLRPGDEVIVPSLTYCATVSQLNWLGITPVLVDSDDNYQMNLDQLDLALSRKTKAVVVPQLYGDSPDMEVLSNFCHKHDLSLIEDSAECFGCKFDNVQYLGTFGSVASFSFFANKSLTLGEGGAVVTNYDHMARKMKLLRSQSHIGNFVHDGPGFNFRTTNLHAAIGVAQLEEWNIILKKKQSLAKYYRDNLSPTIRSIVPQIHESAEWMPLFEMPTTISYSRFMCEMQKYGIETRPCFTPIHLMKGFDYQVRSSLSNSERIYKRGFNLPAYPDLSKDDLKYIVECANKVVDIVG